jgi:hypothetical protein
MSAPRVDEIEPALDDEPTPSASVSVMAMICEPDGTDRSSRISLPSDSDDAAIVHALREVSMSTAQLRGVPTDVADWYAMSPIDITAATAELRSWVTRRIVAGHQPTEQACRELLCLLLRQASAPTSREST